MLSENRLETCYADIYIDITSCFYVLIISTKKMLGKMKHTFISPKNHKFSLRSCLELSREKMNIPY